MNDIADGALFLLAALLAVIVVGYALRSRREDHRVRITGDLSETESILIRGRGAHATAPLPLRAGPYRAEYRFSDQGTTAVFLISATTGDKDLLLVKAGSGSLLFVVKVDERAVVEVEPSVAAADWQIELIPTRRLPSA